MWRFLIETTRAPPARAIATVVSVDESSTTTISKSSPKRSADARSTREGRTRAKYDAGTSRFEQRVNNETNRKPNVSRPTNAARVIFERQFEPLHRSSYNLVVQVPYIGLALLSYLLVLMWLETDV